MTAFRPRCPRVPMIEFKQMPRCPYKRGFLGISGCPRPVEDAHRPDCTRVQKTLGSYPAMEIEGGSCTKRLFYAHGSRGTFLTSGFFPLERVVSSGSGVADA